jgi:NTE family protein
LLEECPSRYRVVGLSGASGGAVSATAGWYGLVAEDHSPTDVLNELWSDIAASNGWELWLNELTLLKAQVSGSLSPGGNPYSNPTSDWSREHLETILTDHIDFDRFQNLSAETVSPAIFVSTVDALTGDFVVFRDDDVTSEAVIASAAVPQLFKAVEIDDAYYWDGFLSQNPPILEFLTDDSLPPVDELWVIRLTPKTVASLPTSAEEISDRTQQIVENLSLTHELRFVELMNEWLDDGKLSDAAFTETTIRTIDLHQEPSETSRLDRRSSFISDLYADGEAEAANFIRELDEDSQRSE